MRIHLHTYQSNGVEPSIQPLNVFDYTRVLYVDRNAQLLPGFVLRGDLHHAALEDRRVPVVEEHRERGVLVGGNVAQHLAVRLDGDGLGIVGIVRLRLEREHIAGLELREHQSALVMLESCDVEVHDVA